MSDAVDFLLERFLAASGKTAFVEADGATVTYGDLLDAIDRAGEMLASRKVGPGWAIQLRGDFGVRSTAWLLAAWRAGATVAPVAPTSVERQEEYARIADAALIVEAASGEVFDGPGQSRHPIYYTLRATDSPGLIIFTSGTSGAPKGAVHDVRRLLAKFQQKGKDLVTLAFLLFDHIAGVDTLLYCLANTSTIVCLPDRSVATVCSCIEAHAVEVLPTAPSFLSLLLLEGGQREKLRSLKIITYGGETMPQGVLDRLARALPDVRLIQKYGTSELGALRSQSDKSNSRWIEFGGAGADWRVADGLLEVRSNSVMLGYLNAPSPFTEDGWYKTGDRVETDGTRIRFLGRDSDLINVGGQKVFPAEVEEAISELRDVAEVAVFGVPHAILGHMVCARVRMASPDADAAAVRTLVRTGLAGRLEGYKIPQRIEVTTQALSTDRFKRRRAPEPTS